MDHILDVLCHQGKQIGQEAKILFHSVKRAEKGDPYSFK